MKNSVRSKNSGINVFLSSPWKLGCFLFPIMFYKFVLLLNMNLLKESLFLFCELMKGYLLYKLRYCFFHFS